jgi:hypothetical protein
MIELISHQRANGYGVYREDDSLYIVKLPYSFYKQNRESFRIGEGELEQLEQLLGYETCDQSFDSWDDMVTYLNQIRCQIQGIRPRQLSNEEARCLFTNFLNNLPLAVVTYYAKLVWEEKDVADPEYIIFMAKGLRGHRQYEKVDLSSQQKIEQLMRDFDSLEV